MGAKLFMRAKDDPGVERFLEYFYRSCVDVLFDPLFEVPEFKILTGTFSPIHVARKLIILLRSYTSSFARTDKPLLTSLRIASQLCRTALLPQPFLYAIV